MQAWLVVQLDKAHRRDYVLDPQVKAFAEQVSRIAARCWTASRASKSHTECAIGYASGWLASAACTAFCASMHCDRACTGAAHRAMAP